MQWGRIVLMASAITACVVAAMITGRPAACDPARGRCPDKDGNLPAIGVFEHQPCDENGGTAWKDSCQFLRRYKALAALDKTLSTNDLVGIYKASDGFGSVELALAPDGWVGYRESTDLGPGRAFQGQYSIDRGEVIVDLPDYRRLPPPPPWLESEVADTIKEYTAINWGPRLYLVQRDSLPDFVNDINRGFYRDNEGRSSSFALPRRRGANEPLCGLPKVPGEWSARLHPQPVQVEVLHAELDPAPPRNKSEADDVHYRIEVDAGLAAGLFPGMELKSLPDEMGCNSFPLHVELDDVYADHAHGRLRVPDADKATLIAKGLKLTTGAIAWQPPACNAATMNAP